MEEIEKVFYSPGDIVSLKHDIKNKPDMIVVKKEIYYLRTGDENKSDSLRGIRCMWFTDNMDIREHVFSTKDLILIKKSIK